MTVTFTCRADDVNSTLSWLLNENEVAVYSTSAKPYFAPVIPRTMRPEITEIRPNLDEPNSFYVTAVLTLKTSFLKLLGIRRVTCLSDGSNISNTLELNILGMSLQWKLAPGIMPWSTIIAMHCTNLAGS